jgi:hypothetical protein
MMKSIGENKQRWRVGIVGAFKRVKTAAIAGLQRKFAGLGKWVSDVCGKVKPKVLGLFLVCGSCIFFAPGLRADPPAAQGLASEGSQYNAWVEGSAQGGYERSDGSGIIDTVAGLGGLTAAEFYKLRGINLIPVTTGAGVNVTTWESEIDELRVGIATVNGLIFESFYGPDATNSIADIDGATTSNPTKWVPFIGVGSTQTGSSFSQLYPTANTWLINGDSAPHLLVKW